MKIRLILVAVTCLMTSLAGVAQVSQNKHAKTTLYPTYKGLIMAGYQGWFPVLPDGVMYKDEARIHIDMWPDVSEYEKTYPTGLKLADGSVARFFSSTDKSTIDLHFKWMKDYGLDGVFMQRFFGDAKPENRSKGYKTAILKNALETASKYQRAIGVMYDLSGLKGSGEDCSSLIEDWKFLVDSLQVTNQKGAHTYLFFNGKPLVTIWGLGFPDRPYNIRNIGIERFIDFLKNDPVYGGCSVMLGVPTFWRDLHSDCLNDPYLHTIIRSADLVMPWTVQRFSPLLHNDLDRYRDLVIADMEWCKANHVAYVPCVTPGFSWHNLSRSSFPDDVKPVASIPRQQGRFYWMQLATAINAGAGMVYVAMFDEVNEGTAIFKVTDNPPVSTIAKFADLEGMPSDHYLWLTGEASKALKNNQPLSLKIPQRQSNPFIKHMYTADPSAHVWADGRLYVYASHDIAPARGCDLMDEYHVFSTDDMVNWVDHGEILRASQVPWGKPLKNDGKFMWAPDCAYKDGTYYFYFPHPSEDPWNTTWKIGVAASKKPASDFKVIGYITNAEPLIDPCVFVDDDGQVYFYQGGGGVCKGGKLKKNMMEIDGKLTVMEGLEDFHEATWVHKRNGIYYLSYSDNHDEGNDKEGVKGDNRMRYATAKSPLGPWKYQGIYMDPTDSYTNHGSIVEYKGQWYAFYHNSRLSRQNGEPNDWLRSVCVDKLYYNPDGTIQKVVQTGVQFMGWDR